MSRPSPAIAPVPDEAPQPPAEGLSVQRIVAAAIAMADAEGLDGLSMRRVATRLGAGTMSLYRYVPGKDALIELMVDAVHGEERQAPPADAGWRVLLRYAARREWRLYSRHPWLLQTVATTRPPFGPNVLTELERTMQAMDGLGLAPVITHWVAIAVSAQVQGAALLLVSEVEEERRTGRTTLQWRADKMPAIREIIDTGQFPMLTRLLEEQDDVADIDAWFEFSLNRLLDGLAVFVESETRPPRTL
ncbi:TetR/AcrR family transcriptional regulator [Nonomuraea sp. NPDC050404]|uniref:TetR/AcrR family transcriptional regulator n=1 Tax=Nonomuraea sp. NPDC050404 TaxID=3155783 RepID=UPI00340E7DE5